jgi:hypothetical protein
LVSLLPFSAFIEPDDDVAGAAGVAGAAAVLDVADVADVAGVAGAAADVDVLVDAVVFFLPFFADFFVSFFIESAFIESDFIAPDDAAGGVEGAGAGVWARAIVDVATKAPASSVASSLFMSGPEWLGG